MATVLTARAVIEAEDRTGTVFSALGQKIDALSAKAAKISPTIDRLSSPSVSRIGAITQAESALSRATIGLASFTAGLAGVAGVAATASASIHAAAQRIHETQRMISAGFSPEEIREAQSKSAEIHTQMPSLGTTETMHMVRNARASLGGTEEALALAEDYAKLKIIAQQARPGQDVTEDLDQLIKGLEIKGATQNLKELHEYMNGIAKGLNAFGDTLKAYQYYELFKYGRQATPSLSMDYMLKTAPTLAQEMGGSTAGKAQAAFNSAILGGVMKHSALNDLLRLGVLKPEDVDILPKTGEAKGYKAGHRPAWWRLAQSDPYEWTQQVYLPALARHGITSKEDILARIPQDFQNSNLAQMIGVYATQQKRIQKDWALNEKAEDLGAATRLSAKIRRSSGKA